MKLILIIALSLVSSVAMADGFRCQGTDFRVKLFNQTQPEQGTRNPAVLIVSERSLGTLATLAGAEIEKTISEDEVTYEGQTNSRQNGRFVYVKLEVAKLAMQNGLYAGQHLGHLTVNADGQTRHANLACARYLKGDRE